MTLASTTGFGVEQPAMTAAASVSAIAVRMVFMALFVDLANNRQSGPDSILRRRAAPAGQIISVLALGQLQRLLQRALEVTLDQFALHAPAQEIRPDEFAERRRVLGVTAGAAQFARQRAERIVDQVGHRFGNVLVVAAAPGVVEGMHPIAIVH